jgi:hypothetical protein
MVHKRLLKRVELSGYGVLQPFDGGHTTTIAIHRQDHTGSYRVPVHDDGTVSAGTLVTPLLCTGQSQPVPERLQKSFGWQDTSFVLRHDKAAIDAVYTDENSFIH